MNPTGHSFNPNPASNNVTPASMANDQESNENNLQASNGVTSGFSSMVQSIPNLCTPQELQMLVQYYMAQSGGNGQMPSATASMPFHQNIQYSVPQNLVQLPGGQGLSTGDTATVTDATVHVASTSHGSTSDHSHVRDSSWLKLQVCPLYMGVNRCQKSREVCDFAHPEANVKVERGMVTVCFDHMKRGECKHPSCKYFHVSPWQKTIVERQGGSNRAPLTNTTLPTNTEIPVTSNVTDVTQEAPAQEASLSSGLATQLTGFNPFSTSTATIATPNADMSQSLFSLYQRVAASNVAASLALHNASFPSSQITPATNMAFQVPCLNNIDFTLNQPAAQHVSALSLNPFDLRNQFHFNGQTFSTHSMSAIPNAIFNPMYLQNLTNRFQTNWNLQQPQAFLPMIPSSTPQTQPLSFSPIQLSVSNGSHVTPGCKRANENNAEDQSTSYAKRLHLPSDNAAASCSSTTSGVTGSTAVRALEFQFSPEQICKNLFVPSTASPVTAPANVVSSSSLTIPPPHLSSLNSNNGLITNCAFFNEDGRPVESVQICRDFLAGRCARGIICNYVHVDNPRDLEIVNNRVQLCRDAIGDRCSRSRCRFYHIPNEILENHHRRFIKNNIQPSSLTENSLLANAGSSDTIRQPVPASNDDSGASTTTSGPEEALAPVFNTEGDSGNSQSPVVPLQATQSPNRNSTKSELSESY